MSVYWLSQQTKRYAGWFVQAWQSTDTLEELKADQQALDAAMIDTRAAFKHDRTTTVVHIQLPSHSLVLKRYNPRTNGHAFSRALRPTRARRCWKMSYAFAAAGLTDRLDSLLSVEDVGVFKPDPRVYQLGCARYTAKPEDILFVSSNGWDAAAAGLFGFKTIWANRAGMPVERLPRQPDFIASGLDFVAAHLSTAKS